MIFAQYSNGASENDALLANVHLLGVEYNPSLFFFPKDMFDFDEDTADVERITVVFCLAAIMEAGQKEHGQFCLFLCTSKMRAAEVVSAPNSVMDKVFDPENDDFDWDDQTKEFGIKEHYDSIIDMELEACFQKNGKPVIFDETGEYAMIGKSKKKGFRKFVDPTPYDLIEGSENLSTSCLVEDLAPKYQMDLRTHLSNSIKHLNRVFGPTIDQLGTFSSDFEPEVALSMLKAVGFVQESRDMSAVLDGVMTRLELIKDELEVLHD